MFKSFSGINFTGIDAPKRVIWACNSQWAEASTLFENGSVTKHSVPDAGQNLKYEIQCGWDYGEFYFGIDDMPLSRLPTSAVGAQMILAASEAWGFERIVRHFGAVTGFSLQTTKVLIGVAGAWLENPVIEVPMSQLMTHAFAGTVTALCKKHFPVGCSHPIILEFLAEDESVWIGIQISEREGSTFNFSPRALEALTKLRRA